MSGVTLASAPCEDVRPPARRPEQSPKQRAATGLASIMGSLRVIEFQLVAFIMVFSASGLVPLFDLVYPAICTAYLLGLSQFAFPTLPRTSSVPPEIFEGTWIFRLYMVVGTVVGMFLPLAYVLGGFARGDEFALRQATPDLYLLSFQILTENIVSGLSLFSPPVRAFVPLLYTIRRIFIIADWVHDVWLNKSLPADAPLKDNVWQWFGTILGLANMSYFTINLLGFLVPRFLPRAFEMYYRQKKEILAAKAAEPAEPLSKAAEDKRSAAMSKLPLHTKKAD